MSTRSMSIRMRVPVGGLVALLAILTVATPAAAAPKTRWVDDDGHAGKVGCAGTGFAFKKLQKAINASAALDSINLCPGVYPERVSIPAAKHGLHLHGVVPWKATVFHPQSIGGNTLTIQADGVTVDGLTLLARTRGLCAQTNDLVLVDGAIGVRISNDHLLSQTGNTIGSCGYLTGVAVASGANAVVLDSLIRDFQTDGVSFNTASGAVRGSHIEWVHGIASSASSSTGVGPAGGPTHRGVAVFGSNVTIRGNTIMSAVGATPSEQLESGVAVAGAGTQARILDNVLRRVAYGLYLAYDSDVVVKRNDIRSGAHDGIRLNQPGSALVQNNRVKNQGGLGMWVAGAIGAILTGNDFRGNAGTDCLDTTSGSGTSNTASTWTGNLGNESNPVGLCTPS